MHLQSNTVHRNQRRVKLLQLCGGTDTAGQGPGQGRGRAAMDRAQCPHGAVLCCRKAPRLLRICCMERGPKTVRGRLRAKARIQNMGVKRGKRR